MRVEHASKTFSGVMPRVRRTRARSGPRRNAPDAAIWPRNCVPTPAFTRRGMADTATGVNPRADFISLKGIASHLPGNGAVRHTPHPRLPVPGRPVRPGCLPDRHAEVRPRGFRANFGNAMREFALSAGKKNFFTFGGDRRSNEASLAAFIGRNTTARTPPSAWMPRSTYPLSNVLPSAVKGLGARPLDLAQMYENRKAVESGVLTSHGGSPASPSWTFLDNHDQCARFGYTGPAQRADQIVLGLACLLTLPGRPLPLLRHGAGPVRAQSGLRPLRRLPRPRGPLGRADAAGVFQIGSTPRTLSTRPSGRSPACAPGSPRCATDRRYLRPVSGDGRTFSISAFSPGVIAFSRILNDQEVVVVANPGVGAFRGQGIVDSSLSPAGTAFRISTAAWRGAVQRPAPW